jgi:hypothetical protein
MCYPRWAIEVCHYRSRMLSCYVKISDKFMHANLVSNSEKSLYNI